MPNTIAQNLARLQAAKTAIGAAITAKGGTVASGDGLEEFPDDIRTIPSGMKATKLNFITSVGTGSEMYILNSEDYTYVFGITKVLNGANRIELSYPEEFIPLKTSRWYEASVSSNTNRVAYSTAIATIDTTTRKISIGISSTMLANTTYSFFVLLNQ